MPNQPEVASHCVVQWEDNKEQYAVVDTKRSKAVSTLKVGVTTLFEGYKRERRRGKILFLGSKKDCFVYAFDLVEDDSQLNTYIWSNPPGVREQSEELAQSLHNNRSSSLQRAASSSSIGSVALTSKKGKRTNDKHSAEPDKSTADKGKSMSLSVSTTATVSSPRIVQHAINCNNRDQQSNSNLSQQRFDSNLNSNGQPSNLNAHSLKSNDQSSSALNSNSEALDSRTDTTTSSSYVDSLLEEIKTLREKNLALQDDLFYQRETSIRLPSDETYQYLKSICFMHEHIKNEHNETATKLGDKLPCSQIELKLAKKSNPSATINNLIKLCFKHAELKDMSYEKIKATNSELLEQVYEYVKHIHAPTAITRTMFSSAISLKCRHLRQEAKRKAAPDTPKNTQKRKQKSIHNNHETGSHRDSEAASEVMIVDGDEDEENIDDIF